MSDFEKHEHLALWLGAAFTCDGAMIKGLSKQLYKTEAPGRTRYVPMHNGSVISDWGS